MRNNILNYLSTASKLLYNLSFMLKCLCLVSYLKDFMYKFILQSS